MRIGKSDFFSNLIVFHRSIFQKFLCLLHTGTDQNFRKGLTGLFFKYGTEITGADI